MNKNNSSILSMDIQYNAVREEILARIKLRQQLLFFSLALAGALLALLEKLSIVVFLYPILSMFLSLSWVQNDHRIADIGRYIRKYLEDDSGWETYVHKNRSRKSLSAWRLITLSNIGSIVTAQIVSIGFAFSFISSVSHRLLFALDIISLIVVIILLFKSLFRKRKDETEETNFAHEEDLKNYLVSNLNIIEQGLNLYQDKSGMDGVEYSVDPNNNKKIDILAIDKNGIPVVIKLKVSRSCEKVIGQCLYYRNRIKNNINSKKVRIIIIAQEISQNLKTAVEDLEDVQLFEYKLSMKLEKV